MASNSESEQRKKRREIVNQGPENSCGSHGSNQAGEPLFDYTCDDCMLPYNHKEYDETPEYIAFYDNEDNQNRIQTDTKFEKNKTKPENGIPDF